MQEWDQAFACIPLLRGDSDVCDSELDLMKATVTTLMNIDNSSL